MVTYYCPNCWEIIGRSENICPICGFNLGDFDLKSFEEKLLVALHHAVAERKIVAAEILGNIHSQRALEEFWAVIECEETNYYFLRAVLLATAKIDHPDRRKILQRAEQHSSDLVASLATKLLNLMAENTEPSEWDQYTG